MSEQTQTERCARRVSLVSHLPRLSDASPFEALQPRCSRFRRRRETATQRNETATAWPSGPHHTMYERKGDR